VRSRHLSLATVSAKDLLYSVPCTRGEMVFYIKNIHLLIFYYFEITKIGGVATGILHTSYFRLFGYFILYFTDALFSPNK